MRDMEVGPSSVQTVYSFPLADHGDSIIWVGNEDMRVDLTFRGRRNVEPVDIDLLVEYLGTVRKALVGKGDQP
jgi:hypothetical protein